MRQAVTLTSRATTTTLRLEVVNTLFMAAAWEMLIGSGKLCYHNIQWQSLSRTYKSTAH